MRLRKNNNIVFLSVIILGLLFLLGFFVPVLKTQTHAVSSTLTKVDANVSTVLQVGFSTENVSLTALAGGGFVSDYAEIIVNTNSQSGYSINFSDKDENTNMVSSTVSDIVASSFSNDVTSSSMPENNWGYSVDGTNYAIIPLSSNPATIKVTDTPSYNDTSKTDVYFGAKTSATLSAATYEDTVIFTIYPNASPEVDEDPQTIFDITYMQEMTGEICNNTTTPSVNATETTNVKTINTAVIPEAILTDKRDNKTYIVRKYTNGECWMAQNLEYDFKTSSGGYSTDANTLAAFDEHFIEYSDIQDENYFRNSGNAFNSNRFYATQSVPTAQSTNNNDLTWDDNGTDGARSYSTNAAGLPNYVVGAGSIDNDGLSEFRDSTIGKPYQRVGNYYNWTAAAAGSLLDENDTVTPNSICPRGWQLPNYSGARSYYDLLASYYTFNRGSGNTALYNNLNSAPLDFWRAGYYRSYRGSILFRTVYGRWWINKMRDENYAYEFSTRTKDDGGVVTGYVNPYSSYYKGYGFTIRCVAR